MNEIPTWWLVLSGLFFFVNVVLFAALAIAMFKIAGVMKDLTPKVNSLTQKVEVLTEKVGALADTTRATVDHVGGKAGNVAGSAANIAEVAATQWERFAPILMGGVTAFKLIGAFREMRRKGGNKAALQEAPQDAQQDKH
jgi:hypothetical protein